jgi:hypothetical protein
MAMEMPKPNDQHRKLQRLAGNWSGPETMPPGPWGPGGPATGKYVARVDLDGFFVVQDYVQEVAGKVTYRGHGVVGWDARAETFTWYWVDSMGEVPPAPARGRWSDDSLVFEHEGERKSRYTYTFPDDRTMTLKIEGSQDGGNTWGTFVEGTYQKS